MAVVVGAFVSAGIWEVAANARKSEIISGTMQVLPGLRPGPTRTITLSRESIRRFAQAMPELGQPEEAGMEDAGIGGFVLTLSRRNGASSHVEVNSDMTTWSEGHGCRPASAELALAISKSLSEGK